MKIPTSFTDFLYENANNKALEYNLRNRIEPYTKELFIDFNKRIIKFIPNIDEDGNEDRCLYRISVGLYELNYNIRIFNRDGDYYEWSY